MAAPMSTLIGPPEMKRFVNQLKTESSHETTSPKDPFLGCVDSGAYISSGNPCLDFLIHTVHRAPFKFEYVQERLQEAWNHDPLTTLKLVCKLRGDGGTGKSAKDTFYSSALWVHQFHPKTLAANVSSLASFGCIEDLPEILYRLLEGSEVRKNQKDKWNSRKYLSKYGKNKNKTKENKPEGSSKSEGSILNAALKRNREMRIFNDWERGKLMKEKAVVVREEKRIGKAKKVFERYHKDPAFRLLYERVSDLFAESLKADMEHLKSNQTGKVSLAAKWCPSIDSSFDKSLLLCESIARKVFPRESYSEYEGVEEAHYVYRIRDRLRKEVLVPLRKVLELPEIYMGMYKWGELPYNQVASAMELYREKLLKHDKEHFERYLEDKIASGGKSEIAAGALLPHEIIKSLKYHEGKQVAELRLKRMVEDLVQQGKFKNCMAICDVSRKMRGTPMEVSVALGLLVSELSKEPWKGKLINFSRNPTLKVVEGETLLEKVGSIKRMQRERITDFEKVFDIILEVAVNGKLKEEDMIKRLFVFSHLKFYRFSTRWITMPIFHPYEMHRWETIIYEDIVRRFDKKGYGNAIPEIVFWNLSKSQSTPVVVKQKGVALVTGFSKNLMKMFLNGDGSIDPVLAMEAGISGEEYQNLCVID